jgi:hypothetical protein
VKYEQEVLSHVGSAGDAGFDQMKVVVFQPHFDVELTTIGLDTPDGRRHELQPEVATALAVHLAAAPAALEAALMRLRVPKRNGLEVTRRGRRPKGGSS